jgi:hypothetical protein
MVLGSVNPPVRLGVLSYPAPSATSSFISIFIDVCVLRPEGWTNCQALSVDR